MAILQMVTPAYTEELGSVGLCDIERWTMGGCVSYTSGTVGGMSGSCAGGLQPLCTWPHRPVVYLAPCRDASCVLTRASADAVCSSVIVSARQPMPYTHRASSN